MFFKTSKLIKELNEQIASLTDKVDQLQEELDSRNEREPEIDYEALASEVAPRDIADEISMRDVADEIDYDQLAEALNNLRKRNRRK